MKILTLTVFFLPLLFGAVTIISCSNSDAQKNGSLNIPESIRNTADKLIISRTGEPFFNEFISPDPDETREIPQGYFMSYRLYMPQRPYVDEKITFVLDASGAVRDEMGINGIPDCNASPDNCLFLIDEAGAVNAAKEGGLPEGIKGWQSEFKWNAQLDKYVWHVVTTLEGSDGPNGFRGKGREMTIDPNSGEIINESEWNIR